MDVFYFLRGTNTVSYTHLDVYKRQLNARSEEILQENQAVTVEPGIYLPEKFGVRIEDLAIVTDVYKRQQG